MVGVYAGVDNGYADGVVSCCAVPGFWCGDFWKMPLVGGVERIIGGKDSICCIIELGVFEMRIVF